jgi:hypothetical protein
MKEALFALQTDDRWNEQFYANEPLGRPDQILIVRLCF